MSQMIRSHALSPSRTARFSFVRMLDVARQRRALSRLDDVALADIGLTRKQALIEANRAFWDVDA